MITKSVVLIATLTLTATAFAQKSTVRRPAQQRSAVPRTSPPKPKLSKSSFGISSMMWQQDVEASFSGVDFDMRSQGFSITGEYTFSRAFSEGSPWFWSTTAGAGLGAISASGNTTAAGGTPSAPKFLGQQSVIAGHLIPTIGFKTGDKSELSLIVPLIYRQIDWATDDANFKIKTKEGLSYGIGPRASFVMRKGIALSTALVYQYDRPSALWMFALDWR